MSLTVFIPIYDPDSRFFRYLHECLESINKQGFRPESVTLAGSSLPNYLPRLQKEFSDLNIEISENNSQSAVDNLNTIPDIVKTTYTKILFQDDVLLSKTVLEHNLKLLDAGSIWVVSSSTHLDSQLHPLPRRVRPRYPFRLSSGINTLGSPSVVALRTDKFIKLNLELKYMYDCEWYLSMAHSFGPPQFLRNDDIGIRIHDHQATNSVIQLLPIEIEITKKLHNSTIFDEGILSLGLKVKNCKCQGTNFATTSRT